MSVPVSRYELVVLAFISHIMAQTGCTRNEAMSRMAALLVATQNGLNVKAVA